MSFMHNHAGTAMNVDRAEADIQFLYLSIGNLAQGLLLAYIFVKGNVSSLAGGLVTGGIVGLLMCVGFDSIMYGVSNIMSKTWMAVDVVAFTVMSAIIGAAVGMVMGMGKKAA